MTPHERILAALRGQPVDRLPWSPFLAYWWESQPQAFQARGQLWFNRAIGADFLYRGPEVCFKRIEPPECEIRKESRQGITRVQTITPFGTLTTISRYSAQGNTEFVVEHPVKTVEDFKLLADYLGGVRLEPEYETIRAGIAKIGADGLYVPLISPLGKTPFQAMIEHYVGTQQLNYFLADCPEEVHTCLEAMSALCQRAVDISVDSPAEAFISWEDSSTTNLSPRQFQRYIVPEINRWGAKVHAAGKMLLHHACGHVRSLLPMLALEQVDAIESLSPPPTGNVEMWDARRALGPEMGLIGGIEPVQFLTLDLPQLREYVLNLIERMGTQRYILANSDSCPPGVTIEKFQLVSKLVREIRLQ